MATADLERLFVSEGAVTDAQLERVRRVASRLQKPRPIGDLLVEMGQLARAEYDRIVRLHRSRLTLPQILCEEGSIDGAKLIEAEEALRANPAKGERAVLVDGGFVTEEQFLHAISTKHEIPFTDPDVGLMDKALAAKASVKYLARNKVVPIRIVDGKLNACMADPFDKQVLGELERIFGVPVRPSCAPAAKIAEALHNLERLRDRKPGAESSTVQYREIQATDGHTEVGEGAVQIVDYLLQRSIQLGASDLHIEPMQAKVRVRARVDGVLRQITELPADFALQVISRVKILAGADISERRLHQDGRIFVRIDQREVDIRVSTYASMFGETIVMRLLDRTRGLVPLDDLGFEPRVLQALRNIVLRTSSGLVIVSGPTGSGKTTTLYSFIDYVNDQSLKVISAEDPVEYVLEGVTQCSVQEKTGPTFADSLRAIVRQDPDIIVVGEIRDGTTANLGVESALTGHKVFCTFHTEDSVGVAIRLLDMKVEPFLLASTLSCAVAQRLVRKICKHCKKPADPSRDDLRFLGLDRVELAGASLMQGEGCSACEGTGYKGRVGVHEVLMPSDDFRDAILRHASSKELRALARATPAYLTLQEDGVLKAMAGVTTLSEIAGNVPRDEGARRPSVLLEVAAVGRLL